MKDGLRINLFQDGKGLKLYHEQEIVKEGSIINFNYKGRGSKSFHRQKDSTCWYKGYVTALCIGKVSISLQAVTRFWYRNCVTSTCFEFIYLECRDIPTYISAYQRQSKDGSQGYVFDPLQCLLLCWMGTRSQDGSDHCHLRRGKLVRVPGHRLFHRRSFNHFDLLAKRCSFGDSSCCRRIGPISCDCYRSSSWIPHCRLVGRQ